MQLIKKVSASIIMLSYEHWNLTHQRLFEMVTRLPEVEIIVVDNGSQSEDVHQGIKWWKSTPYGRKIEFIMLPENKGFGGGNNVGVANSMGDLVIITQNDVQTFGDWLTHLKTILVSDPQAVVGGKIIDWPGGWNEVDHGFIPYAEGWLIGMWRKVWDDIGGFDERYFPCDMEDVDLGTTALSKGYHLIGLNSDRLRHIGGQTISTLPIDRLKITQEHRTIFLDKWNGKLDKLLVRA